MKMLSVKDVQKLVKTVGMHDFFQGLIAQLESDFVYLLVRTLLGKAYSKDQGRGFIKSRIVQQLWQDRRFLVRRGSFACDGLEVQEPVQDDSPTPAGHYHQ